MGKFDWEKEAKRLRIRDHGHEMIGDVGGVPLSFERSGDRPELRLPTKWMVRAERDVRELDRLDATSRSRLRPKLLARIRAWWDEDRAFAERFGPDKLHEIDAFYGPLSSAVGGGRHRPQKEKAFSPPPKNTRAPPITPRPPEVRTPRDKERDALGIIPPSAAKPRRVAGSPQTVADISAELLERNVVLAGSMLIEALRAAGFRVFEPESRVNPREAMRFVLDRASRAPKGKRRIRVRL